MPVCRMELHTHGWGFGGFPAAAAQVMSAFVQTDGTWQRPWRFFQQQHAMCECCLGRHYIAYRNLLAKWRSRCAGRRTAAGALVRVPAQGTLGVVGNLLHCGMPPQGPFLAGISPLSQRKCVCWERSAKECNMKEPHYQIWYKVTVSMGVDIVNRLSCGAGLSIMGIAMHSGK